MLNKKELIHFAIDKCFLGLILVAQSSKGLVAIFFGDSRGELKVDLQKRFPRAVLKEEDRVGYLEEVIGFVEAPCEVCQLPLDERGTDFQRKVWRQLRNIPYGTTVSYMAIAEKIGQPKAVRAVAGACAANPLAAITPCHRVIRGDGSLSGYRWGLVRKNELLKKEAAESLRQKALCR